MDGLTVVLTYEEGQLIKAVTRGNGEIGEVITANARTFVNIPRNISYKGRLTIRGEAIITYSDFERINQSIEDVDAKYKNPRNLCSGSVRQLSSKVTAERSVRFYAFSLVEPEDKELLDSFEDSFKKRFDFLRGLGFDTVEYKEVDASSIPEMVKWFSDKIPDNDFPTDGLVLSFDDTVYGNLHVREESVAPVAFHGIGDVATWYLYLLSHCQTRDTYQYIVFIVVNT